MWLQLAEAMSVQAVLLTPGHIVTWERQGKKDVAGLLPSPRWGGNAPLLLHKYLLLSLVCCCFVLLLLLF